MGFFEPLAERNIPKANSVCVLILFLVVVVVLFLFFVFCRPNDPIRSNTRLHSGFSFLETSILITCDSLLYDGRLNRMKISVFA